MISRFTDLIYGRSSADEDPRTAADQSNTESALLTTSPAENDEWLIVDRSGIHVIIILILGLQILMINFGD